jgi:hypothetical protein
VDDEHLAVDPLGARTGEVRDQRRHPVRAERIVTVGRRAHQLGGHVGAGPGADGVGPYAVAGAAARRGDGQRRDAGLGGGVVGLAGGAEQEGLGGGVDDPRVHRGAGNLARLAPVRGREAGGDEVAAQVDPHDEVPLLGRHREDHPVAEHPGVVDQDVQAPVRVERGREQPFAGGPLGDVAHAHGRGAAVLRDELRRFAHGIAGKVVEHDTGAGAGERQRLRPAETVAGPGHDRHLAVEAHRHSFSNRAFSNRVR